MPREASVLLRSSSWQACADTLASPINVLLSRVASYTRFHVGVHAASHSFLRATTPSGTREAGDADVLGCHATPPSPTDCPPEVDKLLWGSPDQLWAGTSHMENVPSAGITSLGPEPPALQRHSIRQASVSGSATMGLKDQPHLATAITATTTTGTSTTTSSSWRKLFMPRAPSGLTYRSILPQFSSSWSPWAPDRSIRGFSNSSSSGGGIQHSMAGSADISDGDRGGSASEGDVGDPKVPPGWQPGGAFPWPVGGGGGGRSGDGGRLGLGGGGGGKVADPDDDFNFVQVGRPVRARLPPRGTSTNPAATSTTPIPAASTTTATSPRSRFPPRPSLAAAAPSEGPWTAHVEAGPHAAAAAAEADAEAAMCLDRIPMVPPEQRLQRPLHPRAAAELWRTAEQLAGAGQLVRLPVGRSGLSRGLLAQAGELLERHELLRIYLLPNCQLEIGFVAWVVEDALDCVCLKTKGRTATLYRESGLPRPMASYREDQIETQAGPSTQGHAGSGHQGPASALESVASESPSSTGQVPYASSSAGKSELKVPYASSSAGKSELKGTQPAGPPEPGRVPLVGEGLGGHEGLVASSADPGAGTPGVDGGVPREGAAAAAATLSRVVDTAGEDGEGGGWQRWEDVFATRFRRVLALRGKRRMRLRLRLRQ